jgi:hypothetical protein
MYDANYRLALAYSSTCINTNLNCKKGSEMTTGFLIQYPEDKDFKKLFAEAIGSKEQTQPISEILPPK